jgi:hypothetical protein
MRILAIHMGGIEPGEQDIYEPGACWSTPDGPFRAPVGLEERNTIWHSHQLRDLSWPFESLYPD